VCASEHCAALSHCAWALAAQLPLPVAIAFDGAFTERIVRQRPINGNGTRK
jgi:hypothetical protein